MSPENEIAKSIVDAILLSRLSLLLILPMSLIKGLDRSMVLC
jgi:hypothetical protein